MSAILGRSLKVRKRVLQTTIIGIAAKQLYARDSRMFTFLDDKRFTAGLQLFAPNHYPATN
jgi:hypothetical protein